MTASSKITIKMFVNKYGSRVIPVLACPYISEQLISNRVLAFTLNVWVSILQFSTKGNQTKLKLKVEVEP